MKVIYLLAITLSIIVNNAGTANSQILPAFPGAQGFGAAATGGRGGKVVYVTNTNVDGPGSLAEALAMQGKRYILFKTGGVINASVEVMYGDVTIAGHTAPGGIIVRGIIIDEVYDTVGTATNIIIRHLRSRPQVEDVYPTSGFTAPDGILISGAENVIVDHCSFANATDENVQISESKNITIQNCSIAEGLGDHYYLSGMLLNYSTPAHPQDSIAVIHNIFNRVGGRLPEVSCESPYCSQRPLHLEYSSNLLYDPGINVWYNSNIDPAADPPIDSFFVRLNSVNNVAICRPNHPFGMFAHNLLDIAGNALFVSGNIMNIYPQYGDYDLFYCCNDFNQAGNNPNAEPGVATRLDFPDITPLMMYVNNENVRAKVATSAGAFPRDSMDRRLFKYPLTSTIDPTPMDSNDHYRDAFITTTPSMPPIDTDEDGMPDFWEKAHGLNPLVQDHNDTTLSSIIVGQQGYTNLECYLHCLSQFVSGSNVNSGCGAMTEPVSVLEHNNENGITVFYTADGPELHLDSDFARQCRIRVYSVQGQLVRNAEHQGASRADVFRGLTSGVYLWNVVTIHGKAQSGIVTVW